MMRIYALAVLMALAAGISQAAENIPPATPVQEFQLLSLEKAKLAEKLREVIAFEGYYANKKKKLLPEAKRLSEEQEEFLPRKRRVDAQCQGGEKRGSRAELAAVAKCQRARVSLEERIAKYAPRQKLLKDEIDAIDHDESTRKALQETTTQSLAEATELLAKLEKLVPASKEKECILACNARGPEEVVGAQQCVQACIPAAVVNESKEPSTAPE